MSIHTDEIFGPVLSVVRVETYDQAVELINTNSHGSGTAIFTNDGGAARRFQNEVQVGMVASTSRCRCRWRTFPSATGTSRCVGDTYLHGTEGAPSSTPGKVVTSRWLDPRARRIDLDFPQNVRPTPPTTGHAT